MLVASLEDHLRSAVLEYRNFFVFQRACVSVVRRWQPKTWNSEWPSGDPKDVDYRPTLLMKGHSVDVKLDNTESARKQRASKRSERSHLKEVAYAEVYLMLLTLLNYVHKWPNFASIDDALSHL